MPFEYRIHPSVGIARMGDSPNAYFIGREVRADRFEPALQVIPGGIPTDVETGAAKFRDKKTQLAKQGARFRIFCYQYEQVGGVRDTYPVLTWEVTAAEYDIEWRVKLANKKSHDIPPVTTSRPSGATWLWDAGANEPAERRFSTAPGGGALQRFDGVTDRLPLASAFLEQGGQLVVLGSDGQSRLIPHRVEPPGPRPSLRWTFWEDDAADGYVAATVTPKKNVSTRADKNEPAQTARQATVVIAMPQYAIDLDPVVTLFHFALNCALIHRASAPFSKKLRAEITYADDIMPIVKGFASYKFVSDEARRGLPAANGQPRSTGHSDPSEPHRTTLLKDNFYVSDLPIDLARLLFSYLRPAWPTKWQRYEDYWDGSPPRPVHYKQELRSKMPNLQYVAYPQHLMLWIKRWAARAIPSFTMDRTPIPMQLDMAHLCSMSGGSFYPGIEVGRTATQLKLWTADYGVSPHHVDLRYGGSAGSLTELLALPWQSDFAACGKEWWPGSRPVVVKDATHGFYQWMGDGSSLIGGADLVSKWSKLGFIRFQPTSNEYHEDSRLLAPGPPP